MDTTAFAFLVSLKAMLEYFLLFLGEMHDARTKEWARDIWRSGEEKEDQNSHANRKKTFDWNL
jgi:hypothetical protein